jgi:hypothetical protein
MIHKMDKSIDDIKDINIYLLKESLKVPKKSLKVRDKILAPSPLIPKNTHLALFNLLDCPYPL